MRLLLVAFRQSSRSWFRIPRFSEPLFRPRSDSLKPSQNVNAINKLLETSARTKVTRYCEAYDTRSGATYAFLPCVMSTSGRMYGEFCASSTYVPIGAHGGNQTMDPWQEEEEEEFT